MSSSRYICAKSRSVLQDRYRQAAAERPLKCLCAQVDCLLRNKCLYLVRTGLNSDVGAAAICNGSYMNDPAAIVTTRTCKQSVEVQVSQSSSEYVLFNEMMLSGDTMCHIPIETLIVRSIRMRWRNKR